MKRMVNVLFAGVLAMTVLSCGEEKKGYTLNGEISDVKDGCSKNFSCRKAV